MLNIHRLGQLSKRLRRPDVEIRRIIDERNDYTEELILLDPRKPEKPRDVVSVWGPLRVIQDRFYSSVLLSNLLPSDSSHGGIRGRSIKTNAESHAGSSFVFKADIANFYPSILFDRVRVHFLKALGCSANVADSLARLCTCNGHLALGLVTSPILADSILRPIDTRLASACEKLGLIYSRYVDDITISGRFDLSGSGVPSLLDDVLQSHGFKAKEEKHVFGRLETTSITGVRIRNGRLDVEREYVRELGRQLDDAEALSSNGEFNGPFYTENQLRGRVTYVCWINPGRRGAMAKRVASIDWEEHRAEGERRGLIAEKSKLVRRQKAIRHHCM